MAKTKSTTKSTKSKSTKSTPTKSRKTTSKNMKAEVAEELNVDLGANATARENGKVGAEVKKRSRKSSSTKTSRSKKSKKN